MTQIFFLRVIHGQYNHLQAGPNTIDGCEEPHFLQHHCIVQFPLFAIEALWVLQRKIQKQ